jgi:hypothetical protein
MLKSLSWCRDCISWKWPFFMLLRLTLLSRYGLELMHSQVWVGSTRENQKTIPVDFLWAGRAFPLWLWVAGEIVKGNLAAVLVYSGWILGSCTDLKVLPQEIDTFWSLQNLSLNFWQMLMQASYPMRFWAPCIAIVGIFTIWGYWAHLPADRLETCVCCTWQLSFNCCTRLKS